MKGDIGQPKDLHLRLFGQGLNDYAGPAPYYRTVMDGLG